MSNIQQTRVFIDPGHGKPDPGAQSSAGLQEKNVVLKIAQYAQARLKAYGASTLMSRIDDNALSSDKTTDLNARVKKSNDYKAHVFVSIHNNATKDTTATGVETLVHTTASTYTNQLAKKVNDLVASRLGMNNRGLKPRDNVRVIYPDNKAWAILVEVGFLSNVAEASRLGTDAVQKIAGEAIAEGIRNFMDGLPPMS